MNKFQFKIHFKMSIIIYFFFKNNKRYYIFFFLKNNKILRKMSLHKIKVKKNKFLFIKDRSEFQEQYNEYIGMIGILSDFGSDKIVDYLVNDIYQDYLNRPPTFSESVTIGDKEIP